MSFFDVVNLLGLLFASVLVAPHIIYARTHTVSTADYSNRAMVYIARTGRFFSAFLMAITAGSLLLVYVLLWLLFFRTGNKGVALAIAIVAAVTVIFSGIVQVKTLLMTAGIVYLIGELYLFSQFFKKR